MTSVLRGLVYGAAAGAAGTTALTTVTYVDMLLRARSASAVPAEVVARLARHFDLDVPGRRGERAHRLEALGGLAGIGVGVGIGALAGVTRAAGVRLPAMIAGPLLGLAATAAVDAPAARSAVSEPSTWSAADWTADVVPHLAFGLVTHGVLEAAVRGEPAEREYREEAEKLRPPTAGLLVRAIALGAATGARSSAGPTALALRSRRGDAGPAGRLAQPGGRVVLVLLAAGELGLDKSRSIPSRLSRQGLVPRIVLSAAAAASVARRDGYRSGAAAFVAAAGSTVAALLGHRLRTGADRSNGPARVSVAVLEDAVAGILAWVGSSRAQDR